MATLILEAHIDQFEPPLPVQIKSLLFKLNTTSLIFFLEYVFDLKKKSAGIVIDLYT